MDTIWVVAELNGDGSLTRTSAEVATLARSLAEANGLAAVGLIVAADPSLAAAELAAYLPRVVAIPEPEAAGNAWASIAAERVVTVIGSEPGSVVLIGAGPDGRDMTGALSALTKLGVLVNATAIGWTDAGPSVEMSVFGGKLITTSGFTAKGGIVTVRPGTIAAEPAAIPGKIETLAPAGTLTLPRVAVLEQVVEAGAAAPIEEARVIVSGGRGVGSSDGFQLVASVAAALGGAVGATRAAVDAGWIPYAQQIGQTGKIVKPELYLALGISGAIQHKVGMQGAATIIAINRDPDAPIGDFADLLVVGDLFEVVPALLVALQSHSG